MVEAYFMRVSFQQFKEDDKGTVLIGHLNGMEKDLDQYNLILKIVDGIQDNSDNLLKEGWPSFFQVSI